MQASSKNISQADKFIYSYQKALNELLAIGLTPQRLFRILYPVRIVEVYGRQRFTSNIEESQWFVERGIYEAKLLSSNDLSEYLGLDLRFLKKMLSFLEQINHVQIKNDKLTLTELGILSVQEQICYQEQDTNFKLYFDAFGNFPLLQEHMRIKHFDDVPENTLFQPPLPIFPDWDTKSLINLHGRADRHRYGLIDEVSQVEHSQEDKIIYIPAYIVERKNERSDHSNAPIYLAFTNVPGYRDFELEEIVNKVSEVQDWLSLLKRENPEESIRKRMQGFNIEKSFYDIEIKSNRGVEVIVDSQAISLGNDFANPEQSNQLTINSIGKYLLVSDWCIWITCNDENIRRKAAIQQTLEWLQNSVAIPKKGQIERFVIEITKRLSIKSLITIDELMNGAMKVNFYTAIERLETESE